MGKGIKMNHDEYTDYSCSTSIERLTRDVEMVFRKWHLLETDRHISFAHTLSSDELKEVTQPYNGGNQSKFVT
jgi:ABC-type arginine transport system ATPase subunit